MFTEAANQIEGRGGSWENADEWSGKRRRVVPGGTSGAGGAGERGGTCTERAPDHPVIRAAERTGLAGGGQARWPICPLCGAETDTFYRDGRRKLVGCDRCVAAVDAWECETGA